MYHQFQVLPYCFMLCNVMQILYFCNASTYLQHLRETVLHFSVHHLQGYIILSDQERSIDWITWVSLISSAFTIEKTMAETFVASNCAESDSDLTATVKGWRKVGEKKLSSDLRRSVPCNCCFLHYPGVDVDQVPSRLLVDALVPRRCQRHNSGHAEVVRHSSPGIGNHRRRSCPLSGVWQDGRDADQHQGVLLFRLRLCQLPAPQQRSHLLDEGQRQGQHEGELEL